MTKGQKTLEEIYTTMRDKNISFVQYVYFDNDLAARVIIQREWDSFIEVQLERQYKKGLKRWKLLKTMDCWYDPWASILGKRMPNMDKHAKTHMDVFISESGCWTQYWNRTEVGLPKIEKSIEKVNSYLKEEGKYDQDKSVNIYISETLTPGLPPIKMVI